MVKKVGFIVAAYLLSTLVWSCYEKTDCPKDIDQLFDLYFYETLKIKPELASSLGIADVKSVGNITNKLTDVSIEATERDYALARKFRACLDTYKTNQLTPSQTLDLEILKWYLDMVLEGEPFKYHEYLINQLFGVHNNLTTLMTNYHTIETLPDAEDYISRLNKYEDKFEQLFEQLAIRKEKGIMPPRFILETVEKEMWDFIQVPPKNNVLYTSFVERVKPLDTIGEDAKERLYTQVENAIQKAVYPAYEKFITYIKTVKDSATVEAGVWKLPEGEKYYQYCLYRHTTTRLSPEAIHQLGLREVERIQKQIKAICGTLVPVEGRPLNEIVNQYWGAVVNEQNRAIGYPETEEGKNQILIDYQAFIDDTRNKIPQLFSLYPETPVQVKRVPAFQENTMPTHYAPPSLDGKRPGTFYANLSAFTFKPNMQTLTYHEVTPGHHFQISIEQEKSANRKFKNLLMFTGFIEGWALYAEKLGLNPDEILPGNGSNEVIELAVRTFLSSGDEAIMAHPSFVVYSMIVQAAGGMIPQPPGFGQQV